MDPYESALVNALNDQVTILRKIILDNRLHESDCSAFSTLTGDSVFGRIGEKYCDCWISRNNPEPDPLKGFALHDIPTEKLIPQLFRSRADAVDILVNKYSLSRDKKSSAYWGRFFYIVEATAQQVTPAPTIFEVWSNQGEQSKKLIDTSFPSRDEAIKYVTTPPYTRALNPMADNYWGFAYQIKESTGK